MKAQIFASVIILGLGVSLREYHHWEFFSDAICGEEEHLTDLF